jgi:predicted Zn-dependent protease
MATTPQALVEHALVASTADDCIVIVSDSTSANLRWANNTLTTNGAMHGISVTVISFIKATDGIRTGSVTASASSAAQVTALVEAADAAARAGSPAEDAADLVSGDPAVDWDDPPVPTDIHVYDEFASALGEALSPSGMKSRVQRGRAQLREMLVACCQIDLDRRARVTSYEPHQSGACGDSCGCRAPARASPG